MTVLTCSGYLTEGRESFRVSLNIWCKAKCPEVMNKCICRHDIWVLLELSSWPDSASHMQASQTVIEKGRALVDLLLER